MGQGCVDMANPAVAITLFLTSLCLKPQSRVCCEPLPRTLRTHALSAAGITSRKQYQSYLIY